MLLRQILGIPHLIVYVNHGYFELCFVWRLLDFKPDPLIARVLLSLPYKFHLMLQPFAIPHLASTTLM